MFALVCVVAAGAVTAGYLYLQDQAPSRLGDGGYYIRRTRVFFYPGFGLREPFVVEGADPDTFVILDGKYGLDAQRVYLDGEPIPGADPGTFMVIESPYSRDSRYVYSGPEVFTEDVDHFEILDEFTVRDSRHIYWGGRAISDDPAHLVLLGNYDHFIYLKDSTTAFVNGNPIAGAESASFEVIESGYSRDAGSVYYFDAGVPGADPGTFEVVESPYARDAAAVFWMGIPIAGADPATFRVLNADFECSADRSRAYYQDRLIPGVDASAIPPDASATNCTDTELFLR